MISKNSSLAISDSWVPLTEVARTLLVPSIVSNYESLLSSAQKYGGLDAVLGDANIGKVSHPAEENGNRELLETQFYVLRDRVDIALRSRLASADLEVCCLPDNGIGDWVSIDRLSWQNFKITWAVRTGEQLFSTGIVRIGRDISRPFQHFKVRKAPSLNAGHVDGDEFSFDKKELIEKPKKAKAAGGRPTKHDWRKAAAIMAVYMSEHGEPGAIHGDAAKAVEHLIERMGENAPGLTEAKEFVRLLGDEIQQIKSNASNGR